MSAISLSVFPTSSDIILEWIQYVRAIGARMFWKNAKLSKNGLLAASLSPSGKVLVRFSQFSQKSHNGMRYWQGWIEFCVFSAKCCVRQA